jgi:hypothetical protein
MGWFACHSLLCNGINPAIFLSNSLDFSGQHVHYLGVPRLALVFPVNSGLPEVRLVSDERP